MAFIELFAVLFANALVDGTSIDCKRYEDIECQRLNVLDDIYYLNRWLVELEESSSKKDAKRMAKEIGLQYLEPVQSFVLVILTGLRLRMSF